MKINNVPKEAQIYYIIEFYYFTLFSIKSLIRCRNFLINHQKLNDKYSLYQIYAIIIILTNSILYIFSLSF